MRAEILKIVEHFLKDSEALNVITIDAFSNIANLWEYVFSNNYSYIPRYPHVQHVKI